MKSLPKLFILFLPAFMLFSCSSSRKTAGTVVPQGNIPSYAGEYLKKYADMAVREMQRTGIPASITLAQGMLESDYGRSTLARKGNNHFGIKCHNDWTGPKVYHDDNRKGECFRSYPSVADSFRDHSDFLVNGSRYRELFRLGSTDYKGWAHGLKKAGYATNPDYPALLIKKIDEYGLHAYDSGKRVKEAEVKAKVEDEVKVEVKEQAAVQSKADSTAEKQDLVQPDAGDNISGRVITFGTSRIMERNRVQYVIVREGDTFESLAEEFELLAWEISKYNELPQGARLESGQTIYLQPKRSKADAGNNVYVAKEGDTMYSVSQKYAVKLTSLYKLNLMEEGTECVTGQRIRLR